MLTKPEEFIIKNFESMPLWVRVITYFVMLFIVVVGYFSPRYIDGVAYNNIEGQKPIYYKNLAFSIIKDGRKIKYTTSDEGILSIPLPTILPTSPLEIHFYPNGITKPPNIVNISVMDILSKNVKFNYYQSTEKFEIAKAEYGFDIPAFDFTLIKSAFADTVDMSKEPDIADYVISSVSLISKIDKTKLSKETKISSLNLSNPKLSYLFAILEEKYNVVVWSEIWNKAQTINDLIEILDVAINSISKTKQIKTYKKAPSNVVNPMEYNLWKE